MILVDSRTGSRELLTLIRYLGVDAELQDNLDSDFQFVGNGPDGDLLIGIERKAIGDLINSIIEKRLAGEQVGHMQAVYDRCYLVVEGYYRRQPSSGLIEVRAGRDWRVASQRLNYGQMTRFLCSIQEQADFGIWRTIDERDTAAYIADLYGWWSKDWKEHKTHKVIYKPRLNLKATGHKATMFKRHPNLTELWLSSLTGIADDAERLAQFFATAAHITHFTVEDWKRIKGIGPIKAKKIVEEINKRNT